MVFPHKRGSVMRAFWIGGALAVVAVATMTLVRHLSAAELKVGDPAPAFELTGSDGETYKLEDLAGKHVVLAWYPKAFTPGCTAECTSLARDGDALKKFDVVYFTASCDSVEDNTRFAKSVGADYPILSDPGCGVARAYGVVDAQRTFPRRWTFFIGPKGNILHIDREVDTRQYALDVAKRLAELGVPKRK
jgi:thioredoxin-dependent peroxiredoxin